MLLILSSLGACGLVQLFTGGPKSDLDPVPGVRCPVAEIPMRPGGRLTFLPVDSAGVHGYFVVDTDCSDTVVSSEQFTDLVRNGPSMAADTLGGELRVDQVAPPGIEVGPFELKQLPKVFLWRSTPVSEYAGVNISGLIGTDFFASGIMRIDRERQTNSLVPPETTPSADWGVLSKWQMHEVDI
jgi:hypothetical protein